MDDTHKRAIQKNWNYLKDNVNIDGSLLGYLLEQKTINLRQLDKVKAEKTSADKVEELLVTLQRRQSFHDFLRALENSEQEHIANKLRQEFQPQTDGPSRLV